MIGSCDARHSSRCLLMVRGDGGSAVSQIGHRGLGLEFFWKYFSTGISECSRSGLGEETLDLLTDASGSFNGNACFKREESANMRSRTDFFGAKLDSFTPSNLTTTPFSSFKIEIE